MDKTNSERLGLSKHVVLYADDDEDDLQMVVDAFSKYSESIEVITAADGIEAIALLEYLCTLDKTPCLIILDINMPRMNGNDTLKKIRNLSPFNEIPVILFTTSTQTTDKEYANQLNAGFVTKPLDLQQLHSVAELFLSHCTDTVKKSIFKEIL